jgi:hypothetical protein
MKQVWFTKHLSDGKPAPPFSFTYDGRPSAQLLTGWPAKVENQRLDANRARRTLIYLDRSEERF